MPRILVVDDEQPIRESVTTYLARAGHDCDSLPDALPLLEGMSLYDVDLLILDLAMPTPGERAIRAIRERDDDLPIVVLTGVMDQKSIDQLMELGATRVLEKPVRLMHLASLIDLLLAGEPDSAVMGDS